MRSKNLKKYLATKAETETFGNYQVTAKGFGHLLIFARSANAAEGVARRILGGIAQIYNGPLEVRKEERDAPEARRRW